MRSGSAGHHPGTGPAAGALARSVRRVRGRARAVLLGTAAIAALAADVWYEIAANGIALLLNVEIYFTLFFLVAFAVLAGGVLLRTRLEPFSRALDARFALKERLGAAAAYRASRSIPAVIVEAQARESSAAIDFAALRRSFRFRPYGALLALSLGVALTAWLVWRYPEQVQPRNLVFHGGSLMKAAGRGHGARPADGDRGGREKTAARREGPTDRQGAPAKVPPSLPGGKGKDRQGPQPADPGRKPENGATAAKEPEPAPGRNTRNAVGPAPGKGTTTSPGRSDGQAAAARDTTGTPTRSRSFEDTRGVSAVTAIPEGGPGAPQSDLRARDQGQPPALPPLPFFRLLSGKQRAEALLDPGTITIILEAYPAKYRSHLEAFLKALQSRREQKSGS